MYLEIRVLLHFFSTSVCVQVSKRLPWVDRSVEKGRSKRSFWRWELCVGAMHDADNRPNQFIRHNQTGIFADWISRGHDLNAFINECFSGKLRLPMKGTLRSLNCVLERLYLQRE